MSKDVALALHHGVIDLALKVYNPSRLAGQGTIRRGVPFELLKISLQSFDRFLRHFRFVRRLGLKIAGGQGNPGVGIGPPQCLEIGFYMHACLVVLFPSAIRKYKTVVELSGLMAGSCGWRLVPAWRLENGKALDGEVGGQRSNQHHQRADDHNRAPGSPLPLGPEPATTRRREIRQGTCAHGSCNS